MASSSLLAATIHPVNAASPPALDGTAAVGCSHYTNSCTAPITTSHSNDIIIVYTIESLDLAGPCTFSVSDTAGLTWNYRGGVAGRADGSYGSTPRDQIGEFWARSAGVLASDSITESISGCADTKYGYGGEYNGFQAFGVSGANYNNPFDPNTSLPGTANAYSNTPSVTISTSSSNDMIISAAQQTSYGTLTPGSGFTSITPNTDYELAASPVTNLSVTWGDTATWYWEMMADAIQGAAASTAATFYGHVYVAGTTTGIYGATVNIGGTSIVTDSSGYYTITFPTGGTYNAVTTAFGYCQYTASLTVANGVTQNYDFPLSIWDTAAFEPHGYVCGPVSNANPGWYNLRNDYGSMSPFVIYSHSTSSNSISIVTTSSGETGAPTSTPSGDSKMIRMYGSDDSPYSNGYAYTYFYLKNVNIPLSSPMYLAFNIYSYTTPYNNGHVSVDAHFTDGSNLRDNVIDGNHYVTDNFGHRIHPALEQLVSFPYERPGCCVIYPGGWIRVVADLTEIRYKTIDYLMVAYDNGQTGGTGQAGSIFRVYFDDIRLIMPNLSANTINGGFEGSLYGWGAAGTSGEAPQLSSGPCNGNTADSRVCTSAEGSQSVLMGPSPKYTGSAAGDSYLVQTFRVPNDPKFLSPSLTFSSAIATLQTCSCTTNDWASVTLRDRTALQDVVVLKTVGTYVTCTSCLPDGVGWTKTTYSINSLKGHLLWLIINVHNDASGLNTWAWFDGIRIVPQGMTITENSPSAAWVKLDPSVYRGTSDTKIISGSFSSTSTTSFVNGNAGIQVGIDLRNFAETSNSPIPDDMQMATSINAWASGGTSSDNSGNTWGPYFIKDASLTVTVTLVSGDNHFAVTYVETWGFNLNPVAGFDQVQATITALGVLLLPFDALSLIIPALAIPTFVAGTILTGGDVLYNSQQTAGTNGPSPSQTQNWAFPSGPCNAFGCPPPPFRSNPLAGGTAYSTVYLGGVSGAGGVYDIKVQGKADIGQDYCSTNGCFTSAFPISTSYDLTVWTITDAPPVASFSASTLAPYPGTTVNFNAVNSYDPDGYLTSYHWDFGDGTTGSGQTVSHVYKYAGGDTVVLTVTDNAGLTNQVSQQVVVQHCC
jgi:hypothetical protein